MVTKVELNLKFKDFSKDFKGTKKNLNQLTKKVNSIEQNFGQAVGHCSWSKFY